MYRVSSPVALRGAGRVTYRYSPDGRLRVSCNFQYYKEVEHARSVDFSVVRDKPSDASCLTCQSGKTSTKTLRGGFGGLGSKEAMSRHQSQSVRERVAAIDREFPRRKARFLTLTLPSVDIGAFRALAEWCSYAVNRLNVWLNRLVGDHARVSVWEYQKRGALHLHAVIGGEHVDRVSDETLREQWIEILKSIGHRSGANMFASSSGGSWLDFPEAIRVSSERPRKSLSAYLSKYMSKGNHTKGNGSEAFIDGLFFPLASWCQWNRSATALHRKHTEVGTLGYVQGFAQWSDFKSLLHDQLPGMVTENTVVLESDNPYNHSLYCIPDREQLGSVVELLAEGSSEFVRSGYVGLSVFAEYESADEVAIRHFEKLRKLEEDGDRHDEALGIAWMQWSDILLGLSHCMDAMGRAVNRQYPVWEQLQLACA